MRWSWILLLSVSLSMVACGKDDKKGKGDKADKTDKGDKGDKGDKADKGSKASGPVSACDRREKEFLCAEYWGNGANKAWVKEQCDAQSVPTIDKCPADGAIGRCIRFQGEAAETQEVWYAGGEAMLNACESSGGKKSDP